MAIRASRAPRFLTPDDIADHLQVSLKTVRRWIGSGDLHVPPYRLAKPFNQSGPSRDR
jgi:hypothetical protein